MVMLRPSCCGTLIDLRDELELLGQALEDHLTTLMGA